MQLSIHRESWNVRVPFRITGREFAEFNNVVVALRDGQFIGRGESLGIFYLNEHPKDMIETLERHRLVIEQGLNREALQTLLPTGGARNALDCALWDLEAKRSGGDIWHLTGVQPKTLQTVFTIGIEATPEAMAEKAKAASQYSLLKIKLDGHQPLERMQAIRYARTDARIVVDANQGWTMEQLQELAPAFADLGVEMIEQPLLRPCSVALGMFLCPNFKCFSQVVRSAVV